MEILWKPVYASFDFLGNWASGDWLWAYIFPCQMYKNRSFVSVFDCVWSYIIIYFYIVYPFEFFSFGSDSSEESWIWVTAYVSGRRRRTREISSIRLKMRALLGIEGNPILHTRLLKDVRVKLSPLFVILSAFILRPNTVCILCCTILFDYLSANFSCSVILFTEIDGSWFKWFTVDLGLEFSLFVFPLYLITTEFAWLLWIWMNWH